jgi:hypothetical protein
MSCRYDVHDIYDIFKRIPDEDSVWVGAVKGRNRVRQILVNLTSSSGQAFFAWSASEGIVVEPLVN